MHSMVYMLIQSTWLNYIVDSKTKYSDYMKLQLKALNYKKFKIPLWIRDTLN